MNYYHQYIYLLRDHFRIMRKGTNPKAADWIRRKMNSLWEHLDNDQATLVCGLTAELFDADNNRMEALFQEYLAK